MKDLHIVVGSGPAGVACTQALLDAGRQVLMLDAGQVLESDTAAFVRELSALPVERWPADAIFRMRKNLEAKAHGLPIKLQFGSDFCYRPPRAEKPVVMNGIGLSPSYALGGLSNVWGAAMLPYLESDTADWPVRQSELAPHYRAAVKLTGLTGEADALADRFPLFAENVPALRVSGGMQRFLNNLRLGSARTVPSGGVRLAGSVLSGLRGLRAMHVRVPLRPHFLQLFLGGEMVGIPPQFPLSTRCSRGAD
jgi:choline dehydrogenase-like flavoprotein